MLKKKSVLLLFAWVAIVLALCAASISFSTAVASSQPAERHKLYYNQLDPLAKKIYGAFEELYISGDLKTGTGSFDLVSSDTVTQTDVKNLLNGEAELKVAFQNARDAFSYDYYEIFYVDFTKVTLRAGKMGDTYAAFINNGANADYFARGFETEAQVDTAIADALNIKTELKTSIESAVDKLIPSGIGATKLSRVTPDKIVELAHDAIVNKLEFSYPSDSRPYVSGVYGAVDGYANCVGYSSLLKWILDDYSIHSVLVAGTATNSLNVTEEHMWNYIKIDDQWFAVDATWDDPAEAREKAIRHDYLLKGKTEFGKTHYPMGIFSPNGMEFTYPELSGVSYKFFLQSKTEDDSTDLKIYTEKLVSDGLVSTGIDVTYQGKNAEELEQQGLYIAMRFSYGEDPFQPWVPVSAYTSISIIRKGSIQFCVTRLSYEGALYYSQDLTLSENHIAIVSPFSIPYYSNYEAPPFIRKSSPSLCSTILPELTHYSVEYDDELVVQNNNEEVSIRVESTENVPGKISNLEIRSSEFTLPNGNVRKSTILDFDFLPDDSYQGYINIYNLYPTNLVGKNSDKNPNPIPVGTTYVFRIPCPALVASGSVSNEAFVIAVPTLVVNENLDIFEYEGTAVTNPMDIRLVASYPKADEQEKLLDASGEKEILSSSVFELSLACQQHMARLKTDADYNVTVGLPYPKGYNYNDNKDVQFKAYHYRKQPDGTYVAEELICRIGERGLEVLVKDFSPFAVVAVPKTEVSAPAHKFVSVEIKTNGGDVTTSIPSANGNSSTISAAGLHALKAGDTKTFSVQAKNGYSVEKILLNGKEITDKTLTFDFQNASDDTVIEVYFIHETVKSKDEQQGFISVTPKINWTGKRHNISIESLRFESKIFVFNPFKNKQIFKLEVEGLPENYRVDYEGNSANAVGDYVATATINRLLADGTVDETYNTLVLTTNYSVVKMSSGKVFLLVLPFLAGGLVVIGGGIAAAVILIKKRKKKLAV